MAAALSIAGPPGPPGPSGPPGPPGTGGAVSEALCWISCPRKGRSSQIHLFVPQVKTFSSRESMMQHTSRDPEGTMSYVTGAGSLYLKVPQGWKEIQVLSQTSGRRSKASARLSRSNLCCPTAQQSDLRLQQHHSTRPGDCCCFK